MDVLTSLEGSCLSPDSWASQARRSQLGLTSLEMGRFLEGLGVQLFWPGIAVEELENSQRLPMCSAWAELALGFSWVVAGVFCLFHR